MSNARAPHKCATNPPNGAPRDRDRFDRARTIGSRLLRCERVKVDILRCGACGAPVALGEGDHATCAHCNAAVAIPEEHRALRDAVRSDAGAREHARALYEEIGAPPSIFVRAFVFATPLVLLVLGIPFAVVASIILFGSAGGAIGRALFHVQLLDVLSPKAQFIASMGLGAVILLGLLVLGAYARRRGVSLRAVQAGLAMHPPDREGGPSTCRACGAPLTIAANAMGVMCDYCRADNLVRVDAAWIGKARDETKQLASAIEDAAIVHHGELAALRSRLRARLVGWAIIAAVFFGMFAMGFSMNAPGDLLKDWPPNWNGDVAADSRNMHAHRAPVRSGDEPIHGDRSIAPTCTGPWLDGHQGAWSTSDACDGSGCTFRWIVALRHGERVTVETSDLAGAKLDLFEHFPGSPFDDHDFTPWKSITLGPAASFDAPLSAWYGIGLHVAGMRPNQGRSLCFTVARAR